MSSCFFLVAFENADFAGIHGQQPFHDGVAKGSGATRDENALPLVKTRTAP